MKPNSQTLADVLSRQVQYIVPVFQRFYRWDRDQWEKLWENVMELRSPEAKGQHFMGFLVFVPEPVQMDLRLHVIDGQQRLTTLSLLLTAARNLAQENGLNDFAHEITEKYLIDPHKKGTERLRVLLKLRDQQEYEAVVAGEDAPARRITEALSYFERELAQLPDLADAAGLRRFLGLVTTRLEFMCATLDQGEKAYNIFKSLNSTGVPLGAADLIRNFVFMNLRPEEHDEFDLKLWTPLESHFTQINGVIDDETLSEFMRDFLMRDGRYVKEKKEKIFETFEDRYSAIDFSPRALAAELNRFASYYMVIRGEKFDRHGPVSSGLEQIRALKVTTTYPLLLQLFDMRNQGSLSNEDLAKAIELLVAFVLRRFICGEERRGYDKTFTKACSALETSPVENLENYLLSCQYPDDARFKSAFLTFNLYESQYRRFILESIEKAGGHREPADLAGANIEHVMPQTLTHHWRHDLGPEADRIHAVWLHTPGNLALSAWNEALANRPFSEKRPRYAQSNIGITRTLADLERWGEEEIRKRGEAMAATAARIWIGPREPHRPPPGEICELDPQAPPNLFYTSILDGNFGATHVFSWRELIDCAVRTASEKGVSLQELGEIARVQDRDPGAKNFHQIETKNLWLPGMDSNQCWQRSFRLAQRTNTDIKVLVEWEDTEGAARPARKAVLQWGP